MMKYPIGVQSFEKIREDGFAYVDRRLCLCGQDRPYIQAYA